MAADTTFERLWKGLLVHAPELPVPMAQEFVNTAYSRALAGWNWSGLKKYGEFAIPEPYNTGTVSITQGSTTVLGVGTTWTTSMAGRQLIVGGIGPFYDIASVESGTSLTLARPFSSQNGLDVTGSTYSIEGVYLVCPSDFLHFWAVRDNTNRWRLWHNFRQEVLDYWDPMRTTVGTSWLLATAGPAGALPAATAGLTRYEIWPRPGGARSYPFSYEAKPPLMSAASDAPIYPIRGDIVREGALAELSLWPGTTNQPNPMFNLDKHQIHETRFKEKLGAAEREDNEIAQTQLKYFDTDSIMWAPIDAAFIQTHDISFFL